MVITFWFQGIPWNHHKLYPAFQNYSWTPEITLTLALTEIKSSPQVFLWHKSKFNHVLISGNFLRLKIEYNKVYTAVDLLSTNPPTLFFWQREMQFFLLIIISKYISEETLKCGTCMYPPSPTPPPPQKSSR